MSLPLIPNHKTDYVPPERLIGLQCRATLDRSLGGFAPDRAFHFCTRRRGHLGPHIRHVGHIMVAQWMGDERESAPEAAAASPKPAPTQEISLPQHHDCRCSPVEITTHGDRERKFVTATTKKPPEDRVAAAPLPSPAEIAREERRRRLALA